MIKCRLYYCKLRRTRAPHQKFTVVNMMYVCKHRRFTIVKYCCVHLSLIKFFIICRVWSVCDSGLCRCSWPRPPSAAGVRAGFSLSSGGLSFSFCSFFLAARPRPLQGGVGHLGAGHRLTRQTTPVKYYGGKFAPSIAIFFFSDAVSEAFAPPAPVSV